MKRTVMLIILVAWVLIPTGTPDDVLTFYIIKLLGPQAYALLLLGLLLVMWHYKINLKKIGNFMHKNLMWIKKKVLG